MPHATGRGRSALAALGASALALAASVLTWASPAAADEAAGGRLDWGVKESFRSYITGPIAEGEVNTGDGASTVGGAYRFHSATGEYDPDAGTASLSYTGWVHFWGHDGELDVTFANPSIEYSGSSGTLYVYVNGTRTDMAALSGPDIGALSGTVSVQGASATLTAGGAQAFAGYYEEGQALDPVGFTADVTAPEPSSEAAETPTEDPTEDAGVSGAILDWGVRASWREYVSGDIAAGNWEATGGARDGGAVFRFTEGSGEAAGGDYSLAFTGTVAFTGTDVDLAIADPTVTAEGGRGVLSAEVGGERVDLVEFEAELGERDGLLIAEAVPTVLTEAAVEVFGGYYQAGDEMDPLTVAVPLGPDAELPALPDLGDEPEPSPESPSPSAIDADEASTESGPGALAWIAPAAALALLAATATVIAIRRRGKAARSEPAESRDEPATAGGPEPNTPEEPSTEGETTKEQ
ncbi:HtaA domain-containing protein [Glycomyces salinus]|uniref:HtaA domain-containing protein n=1 Tax=Glycomyces salinus TaxID=980294 RepID=UPI0018EB6768|nr:HtaA domain-containing protein [Glycomyces salinus]